MKAIIIGYSGHSYVVIELLQGIGIDMFAYCEIKEALSNPFNLSFLGSEKNTDVANILKNHPVFLGVGNNLIRKKIFLNLENLGVEMPFALHKDSIFSGSAQIGSASVIMQGAIVNAKAFIGKGVVCNSGSIIEHECIISDFAHVAPGAVLAGNVSIGSGTFIGANSTIKEGVNIGNNVVIGAGSVVLKNIEDNTTYVGNPVKRIK